jgi:DNA-binding transcriptional regulator YhcF (GntR family)
MSWTYSIAAIAAGHEIADGEPIAKGAHAPFTYSDDQLGTLYETIKAPTYANELAHIVNEATQTGVSDRQIIASRIDAALGGLVNPALRDPVGADIMVQSPTSQGLANDLSVMSIAQDAGRTTISDHDIALAKIDVDAMVKQMMALGRSDQEIQQAVSMKYGHGDLASVAQEVAGQQLGADKFNLFSNRNQEQSAEQTPFLASVGQALGAASVAPLSVASASTDVENRYGVTAPRMAVADLGPTTAFLAAEMLPTPNVPNVKAPSQNIGASLA